MLHKLIPVLAALLLAVAGAAQAADSPEWVAGEHYDVITPALETQHPNQVAVTEVFSFACPHCAHFQPYAAKIRKSLPEGAVYVYKPAVFFQQWEPYARAFLTAEAMNVATEESSQALFDALHVHNKPIRSLEDLADFYAQYGADPEEFLSTAESFFITQQLKKDIQWERKARVRGTPSIIVDGKYRVTTSKAGGFDEMVQLTLWLVNKELAANQQEG